MFESHPNSAVGLMFALQLTLQLDVQTQLLCVASEELSV